MSDDRRVALGGRHLLRALSRIVPRGERAGWLEEWEGELEALERLRRTGDGRYPRPTVFLMGALPHALWMRKEEWTMDGVLQDLRFAFRTLARAPGFTLAAALTLAVGIGANASVLSLVNGLVLRPPPGIEAPDRLVQIARSYDDAPRWDNWSWPALRAIREQARALDDVAGYSSRSVTLGMGSEAGQVGALLVTGNYFEVLGARPSAGRLLGPADDVTPGAHPVVVLGHDLWQRRFGADPSALGGTVQVAGRPYEVVGVASPGFVGANVLGTPAELFLPANMHPPFQGMLPFDEWGWSWIEGVGRLSEGVTFEAAEAAMTELSPKLSEIDPVNEGLRVLIASGVGLDPTARAEVERMSALLSGVSLLVLLLACANVANLFLARATTRRGEMGIRAALGAGRMRMARQLVTESLVLGVLGALLAMAPLMLAARIMPGLLPVPIGVPLDPDLRVIAAALGLGLLSGVLFGAGPSIASVGRGLSGAIRESGMSGATASTRIRDGLVVAQLTLSLGLLAGAALLGSSVVGAVRADPGFEPEGLLAAYMDLEGTGRYDPAGAADFGERLAAEAASIPGVVASATASQAPFVAGFARESFGRADRPNEPEQRIEAETVFVSGGYFETLGIPVLRGRTLRASTSEPEPVAVVNEALASRFWPGEDAIGKYLTGAVPLRVVGVVGNVQARSLRTPPAPAVYQPLTASFLERVALLVRGTGDPVGLAGPVREVVATLDPGLPVIATEDVRERMAASLGTTRTISALVAIFAGVALVLAVVGLYGLVSFGVSRRTREMGIRLALGAGPSGLVRLVLGRALGLTALGVLGGLGLAVLVGRMLREVLYEVDPGDPVAFSAAALVLVAASAVAAWLPARRASRMDAATTLRE